MKLALTGKSGAGKDYLVSYLINTYNFKRASFSDQLKRIASYIFDWLEEDYPPELKEKPLNIETPLGEKVQLSPREIWLKMNFLREIEDGIFVRKLTEEINNLEKSGINNIVISDIRTLPEYEWCKENGFTVIRIDVDKTIHKEHEFDKQIYSFTPDFIFKNDFNGVEEFEKFLKLNNIIKD